MNKYQERIDVLLNEVIDVCNKKEIPYFISGRGAIRCYGKNMYRGGFLDMEVTIPAEFAKVFIAACRQKENRYVESLKNNPGFPGFYLKYIDTTSTLINYNEGLACQVRGFFIKINLLRKEPVSESILKKAIEYENLVEDTAKTYVELTGETTIWKRLWFRIKKVIIKNFGSRVFDYLIDAYSQNNDGRVIIRTVDTALHFFEKNRFANTYAPDKNRPNVKIPVDAKAYFEECYGLQWKSYATDIVLEGRAGDITYDGSNFTLSLVFPYTYFVERFKQYGITKKFLKIRQRKANGIKKEKEIVKPVAEAWNIANRAGDLWNVFDYYKDRKGTILNLYEMGEFFALKKELKYYDEIVMKYADLNMGFLYDEEIWDIYLYVKAYEDSEETARHLKNLAENDEILKIQLRDMEKELNESFGLYC